MSSAPVRALRITAATKTFPGGRRALQGVSLDVHAGERVALLGASGSGKSTLLRAICGLETLDVDAGGIELFGKTLQAQGRLRSDVRLQRRQVGIVFQQFNLVGRLTVLTNVLTGLAAELPLWRALTNRFSEAEQARALDSLSAVGLGEQAFQRASTLSGGQQQRAAIARALVQGSRLLLADEPVASLDPVSTRRVMEELSGLCRDRGLTLLVSLHHVALARRYCERVVALRDGALVFDGPTGALTPSLLRQLYGTAADDLEDDDEHPDGPDPAAVSPPRVAPRPELVAA